MARLQIKLVGAQQIIAKCDENVLLAKPWTAAMNEVAGIAQTTIRGRTPLLSGRLEASLTTRVDARPVPHYVFVDAGAENHGFRYGWALEAGHGFRSHAKHPGPPYTFHYGGFRYTTARWFSGSRTKINAAIAPVLNAAAAAIERVWAS